MEYLDLAQERRIPYITVEPDSEPKAIVLLSHGIFSEKNEDGRFTRLANELADSGFTSIRFDYTGHGDHSYDPNQLTISNALVDFYQIIEYTTAEYEEFPFYVVASSFGGSLMLLYLQLKSAIEPDRMVLLNPVTDYRRTFLEPECEQMQERFTDERIAELRETGLAYFDDGFYLSLSFLFELEMYTPYETFPDLYVPTLVIHGDEDTAVPYEVTRQQSLEAPEVRFETIEGADHAFVEKKNERRSFKYTIEHLNNI